jgi:hypothetical protein
VRWAPRFFFLQSLLMVTAVNLWREIQKDSKSLDVLTFAEFWPSYVRAHSELSTRLMHCARTLLGWLILVAAIVTRHWWWIALALVVPYALAWISHFFIEHNRPATFEHPLWSWWADQKMVAMMLVGKMGEEVKRASQASCG